MSGKRHHFAWEYKGKRADLDAAFGQASVIRHWRWRIRRC